MIVCLLVCLLSDCVIVMFLFEYLSVFGAILIFEEYSFLDHSSHLIDLSYWKIGKSIKWEEGSRR